MTCEFMRLDGLDEAAVAHANVWRGDFNSVVLVYDGDKILDILTKRDGMAPDDAREYVSYNIEGAYMGPETPIVIWPLECPLEPES